MTRVVSIKRCTAVFVFWIVQDDLLAHALARHFNILMIGNSYTQGNATAPSVGLDLQGLFDADPEDSADVAIRATGSYTLKVHASDPATTDLLTQSPPTWDVIVLQEQSERPGLAIKYGGDDRRGLDQGGPVLIRDDIKPFQPQATVLLYNTWARYPDNPDLIADFNNDPAEMLAYTDLGYDRIRKNGSAWDYSTITSIARVGDAWNQWYAGFGYSDETRLHGADGSHQNERGSYLAAAMLFESITQTSSIGNSYEGAVVGAIGNDSLARLLQQQASATTGLQGESADFNLDGDVDGRDYLAWQRGYGKSSNVLLRDGDADGDGDVDDADLSIFSSTYGANASSALPTTASAPEHSTLALSLAAALAAAACRRAAPVKGLRARHASST